MWAIHITVPSTVHWPAAEHRHVQTPANICLHPTWMNQNTSIRNDMRCYFNVCSKADSDKLTQHIIFGFPLFNLPKHKNVYNKLNANFMQKIFVILDHSAPYYRSVAYRSRFKSSGFGSDANKFPTSMSTSMSFVTWVLLKVDSDCAFCKIFCTTSKVLLSMTNVHRIYNYYLLNYLLKLGRCQCKNLLNIDFDYSNNILYLNNDMFNC